jgi:hypothetical protein
MPLKKMTTSGRGGSQRRILHFGEGAETGMTGMTIQAQDILRRRLAAHAAGGNGLG